MIRPLTLGDLLLLRRKPRSQVMLYNASMLAQPHRPFWFGLRTLIEGSWYDGATFIYRDRGSRAAIQAVGRNGQPEQDIVMLSAYGEPQGTPSDADIWFRLLELLCANAAQHRIQRLYAALSQRHDELREIFRQLGFTTYTHQTVMLLEGPDWDQGTTIAPMRPQSRRDAWAIHKLYGALTPHSVQQAEARVARDWMLPLGRTWRRLRPRAWVLGPPDDLDAYLHLTSGSAAHVLLLLVKPETRAITTDILRFGLGQISDTLPVYLLLREYQRELLVPATDLGFQPIGEQALLLKQTTETARRSFLMPVREVSTEPRAPIPTITSRSEKVRRYVRTTRYHK